MQVKNYHKFPPKSGAIPEAPGLLRRLAAIAYDTLLLLALLFAATAIILPFNGGKAFSQTQFYYPLYLLAVSFLFFGWFWTHGGQTLGMRAWKIKVVGSEQQTLTWKQALGRFCAAMLSWSACGLGFFWIAVSRKKLAWHDSLSHTTIVFDSGER